VGGAAVHSCDKCLLFVEGFSKQPNNSGFDLDLKGRGFSRAVNAEKSSAL
jgi:hypothetical protein